MTPNGRPAPFSPPPTPKPLYFSPSFSLSIPRRRIMSSSPSSHLPPSDAATSNRIYNRKQKSLGLLCSNFVSLYNRDGVEWISLDDAARRLAVERRRIYDIVNILESVGVIAKKAKNSYSWIGFSGMPKALCRLRDEACGVISCGEGVSVKDDSEDDGDELDDGDEKPSQTINSSLSDGASSKARSASNRKEKSLGMLTENFIKLFMTADTNTISLDEAARLLLGANDNDASYMRTKVRRLYDIANVLSSIHLVEKTQLEARKPAFCWLGTTGKIKANNCVTVAIPPDLKKMKRIFGTEITNTDSKSKMDSAVNKKQKKVKMTDECNIIAQKQIGPKNAYAFGPFRPIGLKKQCAEVQVKCEKGVQEWESLAAAFRPLYHNQALSQLFEHYKEAWKRWNVEASKK